MGIPYYLWSTVFIVLACTDAVYSSGYTVEFITGESPPATIPTACNLRKYNLPVNRVHSYPVRAYLKNSTGDVVEGGDNAFVFFDVVSLNAANKDDPAYVDPWIQSGGRLCRWGMQGLFPRRIQRKFFTVYCSESTGGNVLGNYTMDRGEMIVDGLRHDHPNSVVPTGNRVYRFIATLADGTVVTGESNEFEVTAEAKELQIVTQPPTSVEAQEVFSVGVRVVGHDDLVLTSGADSCAFVELSMPWYKDVMTFYGYETKWNMLYYENLRLRGDAVQRVGTRHWAIREELANGVATFNNIKILDITDGIQLNVTCTMQSFPYTRRPDDYEDLAGMVDVYEPMKHFYQNQSYPLSKAIVLTNEVTVTQQTATTLVILNKANIKPKQMVNFLIPDVVIEIQDAAGNRIYSGEDANLAISVAVTPSSACLSVDASFNMTEGQGQFPGSVCEPISSVTLTFSATSAISSLALTTDVTPSLEIRNEIHLANFQATDNSGADNWVGSHLDAFAHFAKEDINSGYHGILAGRTIVLHSYDHQLSSNIILSQYKDMKKVGEDDPSQKVQGIIGFSSNELTSKVQPQLTVDKIPQLGLREDMYDFGDKELYPYYNRISWEQGATTHSIMLIFKKRGWTRICVLKSLTTEFSKIFYSKATELGIELLEVTIPEIPIEEYDTIGNLAPSMEKIRATNTVVVWVFVMAPLYWKVIREAYVAGVSPAQGYQWLISGIYAWQQPFYNQIGVCQLEPLCTVILRGSLLFAYTYNLNGLRTPWWERTLSKHIKKDTFLYAGTIPKHTINMVTAEFSLTYDAMMMIGYALDNLVQQQKTITGPVLADEIKTISFEGLTGDITMNEKGNRVGSIVFLTVIDPIPPELGTPSVQIAMFNREFYLEEEGAMNQLEIRLQIQWPLYLMEGFGHLNPYALPNTTFLNKVKYNTTDGMKNPYEEIVPIPGCLEHVPPLCSDDSDPPKMWVELEEYAPAPFYCVQGCGGNRTNDYDITQYEFGTCITMNECQCNPGYLGDDCNDMICLCTNGHCDIPETCICEPGWTGDKCSNAICTNPCVNGRCTSPDVCTCDGGYVGSTCSSSLGVIVSLPVISVVLLIVAAVFFGRWFLKRQARKAALANLDWKVNWEEEVQTGVGAISMVSTAAEELTSKKNYVTWKAARCYAQKYDCDNLDVNDLNLRMEVVRIKELRHNNLIHFIGACLAWPNVSILTEPCPKGSLEDLLANDNIKLTWDFKYSLLKDICRGMDYLHRSEIESHGRLKSTNCLVDNRWTLKISGFGLPTIRYSGKRKAQPDKDENVSSERNLFWTAPELLNGVKHIDQVGKGSQAGDVYGFAVIMSEVITREEPYSHELMNMEAEDVVMLVIDKDAPAAAKAKRKWYEGGGDTTKIFRPKIDENSLPSEYAAKNGLRKLVDQNWHNSPDMRLSFRHSLEKLNEIHPIKGELIDNLINMLEKYSSNLESIVAERTKELQVEKAKTEQLVSQMLPKKVVEDLKHGRVVEPESFECVTIFFSDLVGFTAIAKNSTPLQVVDLLNDLYTTFDAILDNYDVYKVETIGDAYMVVSGLPIRNGDLHAGEIATMSLDLLSSMCAFKIRHMPGTVLQLRIGMHSGSCVAGVVGLKMPRYCLFGDTVNTSSRMESSSMALRIHMSEHTANILFKLGGYHLDCRGEREVKGKGTMTTYWLEGKDGFTKPLPGKDMAASLSQHEFK